jgi:hypothetical protein
VEGDAEEAGEDVEEDADGSLDVRFADAPFSAMPSK